MFLTLNSAILFANLSIFAKIMNENIHIKQHKNVPQ